MRITTKIPIILINNTIRSIRWRRRAITLTIINIILSKHLINCNIIIKTESKSLSKEWPRLKCLHFYFNIHYYFYHYYYYYYHSYHLLVLAAPLLTVYSNKSVLRSCCRIEENSSVKKNFLSFLIKNFSENWNNITVDCWKK